MCLLIYLLFSNFPMIFIKYLVDSLKGPRLSTAKPTKSWLIISFWKLYIFPVKFSVKINISFSKTILLRRELSFYGGRRERIFLLQKVRKCLRNLPVGYLNITYETFTENFTFSTVTFVYYESRLSHTLQYYNRQFIDLKMVKRSGRIQYILYVAWVVRYVELSKKI